MTPHPALVDRFRNGFEPGFTVVTEEGEPGLDTGIDFGVQVQRPRQVLQEQHPKETAWVLLQGGATVVYPGHEAHVARRSLFDEGPTVLHVGPDTPIEIRPHGDRVEWAVLRSTSGLGLAPRLFRPKEVETELRGRGLAQGACVRTVRLAFDRRMRPESGLVVGEVVAWPGRWSSWPPHAHRQPEIYHYRFTLAQGYGHAELDDEVFRVQNCDTLKIMGNRTHPQVAAPGYGMWYLWVVRHLDDAPYEGFEFDPSHAWMLDARAQGWEPRP